MARLRSFVYLPNCLLEMAITALTIHKNENPRPKTIQRLEKLANTKNSKKENDKEDNSKYVWSPEIAHSIRLEHKHWIEKELAQIENENKRLQTDMKAVILTLHRPTDFACNGLSISSTPVMYSTNYSNNEQLFSTYSNIIEGWFFGHTHYNSDIMIRVIANKHVRSVSNISNISNSGNNGIGNDLNANINNINNENNNHNYSNSNYSRNNRSISNEFICLNQMPQVLQKMQGNSNNNNANFAGQTTPPPTRVFVGMPENYELKHQFLNSNSNLFLNSQETISLSNGNTKETTNTRDKKSSENGNKKKWQECKNECCFDTDFDANAIPTNLVRYCDAKAIYECLLNEECALIKLVLARKSPKAACKKIENAAKVRSMQIVGCYMKKMYIHVCENV